MRAMLGQADDLNTITSELFGHERGRSRVLFPRDGVWSSMQTAER